MQRRTKQIQPTDLKMRAIGAVVREFREQAGHSQERLSGDCGFDRTYISRVERGIINPTVGRLWQIADALENPAEPSCQADGILDYEPGAKAKEAEWMICSPLQTASSPRTTLTLLRPPF